MLLFIAVTLGMTTRCLNFNTSHVTVYQSGSPYLSTVPRFQYISCYCLSFRLLLHNTEKHISIHLMLLFISGIQERVRREYKFQYISCYCLSFAVWRPLRIFLYFNTSHVTVYRTRVIRNGEVVKISIHLMLLFIC